MSFLLNHVRSINLITVALLVFGTVVIGEDAAPANEAAKLLPETIQALRATGPASGLVIDGIFKRPVADANAVVIAIRTYADSNGRSFSIEIAHTERDSVA